MKRLVIFLCVTMVIACVGCTSDNSTQVTETPNPTASVDPVVAQTDALLGITDDDIEDYASWGDDMQFIIAVDMYDHPNNYYDKTVRISGRFSVVEDEETGDRRYYCIVDGKEEGVSVVLILTPNDSLTYPDDFPENDSIVTVQGKYGIYHSEDEVYVFITDATFVSKE